MSFDPHRVAHRTRTLAQGFAQFLLRGRTADLAVAVVIGAAIGALINEFVKDIFTPFASALVSWHAGAASAAECNASGTFCFRGYPILYTNFVDASVSFLVIALVVYFFVIVPTNKLVSNSFLQPSPDPAMRKCPECQADIPKLAKRCMYCTQPVAPE
ncbi:MAG TPA: MscL family protein [Candidatus Baltobacteraceae bacterium]